MKLYPLASLFMIAAAAHATAPEISTVTNPAGDLTLNISNLSTGGTYYVEHTSTLISDDWNTVHSFEGLPGSTNWTTATSDSGFFRAVRETYHPKVGQAASLDVPGFHDVSGTAHIINNHTIELRNFNFDGGGIYVEVWLSESGNFPSDYISISGDLIGTVFTDATVQYEIPEGTDLSKINYISIWCVPAGASFGDGQFQ